MKTPLAGPRGYLMGLRSKLLGTIAALALPSFALSQAPEPTPTPESAPPPGPSEPTRLAATPGKATLGMFPRDGSPAPPKRFWRAAGEVVLMELVPWSWDRYVMKEDFSFISWDTFQRNWHAGFGWDNDDFLTNQSSHPYQGSLYFNSARTNGMTFWEALPFAAAGSLVWELTFENTQPSTNDLVNTTLGGAARGEAQFRLSRALLDNTARGTERFLREAGAAILNPVGFLNRLIDGELGAVFPNPDDRLPEAFTLFGDLAWQHTGGDAPHADQVAIAFRLRYGDPHAFEVRRPFDYFDMDLELASPGGLLVPRSQVRGILAAWNLMSGPDVHQMLAAGLRFEYFSTGQAAFGGQGVDFGLLSRRALGRDLDIRTEANATGFILAGIQTDYTQLALAAVGRNYDYGPGGGLRLDARLRKGAIDLATVTYALGWFHTSNGISKNNRLQALTIEGRYPITSKVGAGASFRWDERLSTYDTLPSVTRRAPSLRANVAETPTPLKFSVEGGEDG